MKKSAHTVDIFLQQGEVYFGDRHTHVRTVLGSCVAITMWHPDLLIGGMCHYMLPTRHPRGQKLHCRIRNSSIGFPSRRATDKKELDGKYADEALELMFSEIQRSETRANEYQIKLFGGGNMFPATTKPRDQHVGSKNIAVVTQLLAHHGLKVSAEHLGGIGHRNLIFDIGSGHVWMRHQAPAHAPCSNCEAREICLPT
ncbi:MAG: chemotaxis protein CheD [Burkholderiaceae bacterium]|nr:chemotaxis protein CheD [Burkholderiaceae bacterium]